MSLGAEQRYYLMLKSVYYYYEKNYTQVEIAQMLNVSRITLGKLLKEARDEGMVKIEIVDVRNVKALLELEAKLKDRFGLLDVKVVDCVENERSEIRRKLAAAGAKYFEHLLRPGLKIGMAWGRTLEMLIDFVGTNRNVSNLEVITLLGGSGTAGSNTQPNIIAQRLLDKYSGAGYILNVPYLCQTEELCQAIYREPHITAVLERSKTADITLIGLGETPRSISDYDSGYSYTQDIIDDLKAAGAVGDICANFYDINGNLCNTSIRRKTVAIDIRDLSKHKKVIAVGGAPNKWASVVGALRGGYLDVLITDKFTAQRVLEFTKDDTPMVRAENKSAT